MAKFTFSSPSLFAGSASTLEGNSSNDTLSFETATSAITLSDTLFSGLDTTIEALVLASFSTNRASLGANAESKGFSSIFGGAQSDYISAAGYSTGINIYDLAGINTLIGGDGNDRIIGSANDANSLFGNGGNDTIEGGGGNDTFNGGAGSDRMTGKAGNDLYIVDDLGDVVVESLSGGTDSVLAKVSDYTLAGNTEWLTLDATIGAGTGNSLSNTLVGNSAANTLNGGAGNDSLVGLGGNDYYIVDSLTDIVVEANAAGTDSVEARVTGYTLAGNTEILILGNSVAAGFGNSLSNILLGNSLANTLSGGVGSDTMDGGAGNDFYIVDSLSDKVVETLSLSATPSLNGGIDSVLVEVSGYTLAGNTDYFIFANGVASGFGNSLNNTLLGNSIANTLDGSAGNDSLDGGGGNDTLNGGEGADSLIGGAGADFYIIDNLGDKVFESLSGDIDTVISSVDFTLGGNVERLTLTGAAVIGTGNSLANTIVGNSLANTLDGGAGNDSLIGSAGNDYYIVDSISDIVVEGTSAGTDSVVSNTTNYILAANVEALILNGTVATGTGNSLNNTLIGNSSANTINGDAGNDWIEAGAGNDWLNGGVGNDTMDGGLGNDYYIVDSLTDLVVETSTLGGNDSVVANVNAYTLNENTEWLILDAAVAVGTGNSSANTLIGNVLANTLNGGAGNDSLVGSFGNDYYIVDSLSDKVIESLGGGTDSVLAEVSGYTLSGNTEWLILGSTVATGIGNSLGNTLVGNSLENTLDGGAGADSLAGGKGDDVYIVNDAENAIFEAADSGVDTVISSASFTLGLNVEKLTLTGTAVAGFGNSLANTIIGNSVANTLDGGTGNDSLIGGAGNDYYTIDSLSDDIVEATLNGGVDSVFSKISGYTLESNVEVLILGNSVAAGTGNSIANTLIGNSAPNTLDGGAGVDSLLGLTGNDYYIIDSLADKVFEAVNAGTDSVLTQVTGYTLAGNTEWLILASSIESGTGNSLANTLIGNSAANTLDGALGNDSLVGLAGDDYYIVDSLSDIVFESLNGGNDSVVASVNGYTLSGNVEWLTLASTIGAGTGNALANTLVGNSATNTLDGGAGNDSIDAGAGNDSLNGGLGNDTLIGGLGNDYYIIDSLTDVVLESSSLGGNDSVLSSVNHTLGDNFEVLILGGSAISGTGNSLANTLIGNSAANTLDGGLGNDSLVGFGGNDFYIVDSLSDAIFESVDAGTDIVLAQVNNYTLAGNTEWLRLDSDIGVGVGNSLANTLLGNSAANTLNGGLGNDSMVGLGGDDFYIIDSLSDVVFESLNGGLDSVVASVTGYTLSGNVEWLRLDSTVGAGIGNSLANTLVGNASANTLDGGTGNDSLVGLAGNDYYIIDSLSDEIVESSLSGGVDSVLSKVTGYTLEDHVEVLTLAGTVAVGTGNSLANTLIGNSAANTIDGGLGNDSLIGLGGNDYYKINSLTDAVVEAAEGGIDSVLANVNGYTLAGNAEWLILDSTSASGVGNSLANTLLGNAEDNTLNGGLGSDSLIGGAGDDYYIIDSTSDAILENTGAGIDSVLANLGVYTLAGNTEVLITGTGTTGIGNILDNTLIGNSLSNLFTGNAGNDSLFGNTGDDNLTGCANLATGGKGEIDTLTGGVGSDIFNLGSALGVFYNDGIAGNAGAADYAFITDFTIGKDILKLKGTQIQYTLGDHTVEGLASHKGLYFKTGTTDELIAIIQTSSGTLDASVITGAQFV